MTAVAVDPRYVIACVAAFYRLTPDDLTGACRSQQIVRPRHLAIWILHRRLRMNYHAVGRLFGGRDHQVTRYAVSRADYFLAKCDTTRDALIEIERVALPTAGPTEAMQLAVRLAGAPESATPAEIARLAAFVIRTAPTVDIINS